MISNSFFHNVLNDVIQSCLSHLERTGKAYLKRTQGISEGDSETADTQTGDTRAMA